MSLFSIFYFLLAAILYIAALPFLLLLSLKKKYKESIPARFFLLHNPSLPAKGIWFHACSFGEVLSLKPLVAQIEGEKSITVITNTGYEKAKTLFDHVRFLPFEVFLPFWIKKQRVLVVTEAELWYMLFFAAKKRGVKTILINARISDNSYKSYLKFQWFYKKLFENIDVIFAQTQKDQERLLILGAKNVSVNGNIKSFQKIEITKQYTKPQETVITLASTHHTEEMLILKQIEITKEMKVIVVPRHPERFAEVDRILQYYCHDKGLLYSKFSTTGNFDSDVTLVDMMGELINIYAISDLVILGGSFIEGVGGHNPLEPAHFHCKLISGKYIFNQQALFELVENSYLLEREELRERVKYMQDLKTSAIIAKGEIEPILREINHE